MSEKISLDSSDNNLYSRISGKRNIKNKNPNTIIKSKVFTIYTTLTISFIFFESSLLMLIYFVAEILNPQFTNIAK